METTKSQEESLRRCIKINIKRNWRKHIIIIIAIFFYLQVANAPSKPGFKANLSERIIREQIAV